MPRGRHAGHSRRAGRVRYSWHGFYQPTLISLDTLIPKIFVLYDPRDADHQEEVVHERTIGTLNVQISAASGVAIGWGIYVVEGDGATPPNVPNAPDVLGVSSFDIEANWSLWHGAQDFAGTPAGLQRMTYKIPIDVKARRKIQDPQLLVLIVEAAVIDRGLFDFNARSLVREGRF